jgi:Radical SAM superfamily
MRRADFSAGLAVGPISLEPRDVPHLALETNRTCNIRCRLCYNIDRGLVKPLVEVRRDLDLALSLRNLTAVTVTGGEPTLHPELPAVIRLIKARGLKCNLLTNGLRFLEDDGPALLGRIKRAGVDRVYLHIDSGQAGVHPDLGAARHRLAGLLEAADVPFALSITLYGEPDEDLAAVARRLARFRRFEGILAALAHDPGRPPESRLDLKGPYEGLKRDLGLEPLMYLPADRDDDDVRWLVYFYIIDAASGTVFPLSSRVRRSARRIFRSLPRRKGSAQRPWPSYAKMPLTPVLLAEALLSPRRVPEVLRMLGRPGLRAQFITIQSPPVLDFAAKRASICRGCPDATVRNGRLVPLCLADLVSPLDPSREPELACPAL